MTVKDADLRKMAELARLAPSEEMLSKLIRQTEALLSYFEVLSRLDTSDVEPTAHAADLQCPMRADVDEDGLSRDEVLEQAPAATDEHFIVRKVI